MKIFQVTDIFSFTILPSRFLNYIVGSVLAGLLRNERWSFFGYQTLMNFNLWKLYHLFSHYIIIIGAVSFFLWTWYYPIIRVRRSHKDALLTKSSPHQRHLTSFPLNYTWVEERILRNMSWPIQKTTWKCGGGIIQSKLSVDKVAKCSVAVGGGISYVLAADRLRRLIMNLFLRGEVHFGVAEKTSSSTRSCSICSNKLVSTPKSTRTLHVVLCSRQNNAMSFIKKFHSFRLNLKGISALHLFNLVLQLFSID